MRFSLNHFHAFAMILPMLSSIANLACAPASIDASLLEVHSIGPSEIHEGQRLVIDGAGFEAGEVGELRLTGQLIQPALGAQDVDVRFETRAISGTRATALVLASHLHQLGGRGTFYGSAELSFVADAAATRITGELETASLDFHPANTPLADRHDEAGAAFAESAGLVLSDGGFDDGVIIALVSGQAEAAGVEAGDRLVALSSVRVHSLSDLRPPPEGQARVLTIYREGVQGQLDLVLSEAAVSTVPFPWVPVALLVFLLFIFGPPAHSCARYFLSLQRSWARRTQLMISQIVVTVMSTGAALIFDMSLSGLLIVLSLVFVFRSEKPGRTLLLLSPAAGASFFLERLDVITSGSIPSVFAFALFGAGTAGVVTSDLIGRHPRRSPVDGVIGLATRSVFIATLCGQFFSHSPAALLGAVTVSGLAPEQESSPIKSVVLLGVAVLAGLAPDLGIDTPAITPDATLVLAALILGVLAVALGQATAKGRAYVGL